MENLLNLIKKMFLKSEPLKPKSYLDYKNIKHYLENNKLILKTALKYNRIVFARRILDFIPLLDIIIRRNINLKDKEIYSPGAGSCDLESFLYELVAPKKIICTDIKKPSYLIDNKKFNPIHGKKIDFILEDAEKKNVSDLITKKFNLVISTQVLEHVENCDKYFAKLINSIKKDSYLYLTTPYWNSQDKITEELKKWAWEVHSHYYVGFDIEYFKKFENNLGFKIIEYGPTGFYNQKMVHSSLVCSESFLKNEKCDEKFINSIFYLQSLFHYQTLKSTNRSFKPSETIKNTKYSDSIFLLIKKI